MSPAPIGRFDYFLEAGVVLEAGDEIPCSTERPVLRRATKTVRLMEVIVKMIAHQVVTLVSRLVVPRGPNAVCDPWPPNAPARSALVPCCSRMTAMSIRQTVTCRMVNKIIISSCFLRGLLELPDALRSNFLGYRRYPEIDKHCLLNLVRKRGLEPLCLSAPPPQDGVSANFTTSACSTALFQ